MAPWPRRERRRRASLPARRSSSNARSPSAGILWRRRGRGAADHGCKRVSRRRRAARCPLQNLELESLLADQALERGDSCFIRLEKVGGLSVIVEPPASYLATQMRIRLRHMSWHLASPCRVSPARNSSATWRLNATLWVRCLGLGFILRRPAPRPIHNTRPVRPEGPTPLRAQSSRPIHSQIRCTERRLMPVALAIARPVLRHCRLALHSKEVVHPGGRAETAGCQACRSGAAPG
jgi:hypothetical protein